MATKAGLGSRIRGLRQDAGRTLAATAAEAGLSTSYLNDIEHGRTVPTLKRLEAIGRALGNISVVELLRGISPYDDV